MSQGEGEGGTGSGGGSFGRAGRRGHSCTRGVGREAPSGPGGMGEAAGRAGPREGERKRAAQFMV